MSYKVLEHQLDPDKELERYQKCLARDGVLYMSVPTWFNSMVNFGMSGFDLEYYLDPNHINVWTVEVFENMLARAGFEITKNDQVIYSSTYLCKANDDLKSTPLLKLDPKDIKEKLAKIKTAYLLYTENKFEEAIKVWPDYPQAHASNAEMTRRLLTEKGWDWWKENIINKFMKDCPTSTEAYTLATDFAMRAGHLEEAIKYAEQALARRPENVVSLHQLVNVMREMALRGKDIKEQLHYFAQAREVAVHLRNISTQHFKEATDFIYFFNSKLPFKGENIEAVASQAALTSALPRQEQGPQELML